MAWCYRSQYVKCGNKRCKSCPHGPYWYRFEKRAGRTYSEYVGKQDPFGKAGESKQAATGQRWDDINNSRTATKKLACEILGIPIDADFATAKATARRLLMENHPDRGGDNKRYCHINNAWTYLKSIKGWS